MKQILFVLAILISGIASAQSTWNVSVCDGELVHNYQRYDVIDNLLTENHQGNLPGGRSANTGGWFCLDNLLTATLNERGGRWPDYHRYFVWYCNAVSSSSLGDTWSGDQSTIRSYVFANGTVIRIYPSEYADGHQQPPPNGFRRIHNSERNGWEDMFEVRSLEGGTSSLSDPNRFHTSAQSAWNWANR